MLITELVSRPLHTIINNQTNKDRSCKIFPACWPFFTRNIIFFRYKIGVYIVIVNNIKNIRNYSCLN